MPKGDLIFQRLVAATPDELQEICKALSLDFPKQYIDSEEIPLQVKIPLIDEISAEYRAVAGHTFLNIFRSRHEFPYKQILIDVADKLNPDSWTDYSLHDKHSEEEIEDFIEKIIFAKINEEWDKLSDEEKQQKEKELKEQLEKAGYPPDVSTGIISLLVSGGLGAGVGAAVASPVTVSLFYSGFFASISASIFGVSSSLLLLSATGVGLLVAVPVMVGALFGGTSYKKTIPATLQLIGIRRRLEAEGQKNA